MDKKYTIVPFQLQQIEGKVLLDKLNIFLNENMVDLQIEQGISEGKIFARIIMMKKVELVEKQND